MRALNRAGYGIMPQTPTETMSAAGRDAIEIGQYRPSAVAGVVYEAMVEAGRILP